MYYFFRATDLIERSRSRKTDCQESIPKNLNVVITILTIASRTVGLRYGEKAAENPRS